MGVVSTNESTLEKFNSGQLSRLITVGAIPEYKEMTVNFCNKEQSIKSLSPQYRQHLMGLLWNSSNHLAKWPLKWWICV